MAARARLQAERKSLRQDRSWIRCPQNLRGFEAKPRVAADGSQDLMNWACSIPGPENSPWADSRLPLSLSFTTDYPQEPPYAKFDLMPGKKTSLFHPNIFPEGEVCLDVLRPKNEPGGVWQSSLTIKTVLIALRRLLAEPNNNDPAQAAARDVYRKSRTEWEKRVKAQVAVLKDHDLEL